MKNKQMLSSDAIKTGKHSLCKIPVSAQFSLENDGSLSHQYSYENVPLIQFAEFLADRLGLNLEERTAG